MRGHCARTWQEADARGDYGSVPWRQSFLAASQFEEETSETVPPCGLASPELVGMAGALLRLAIVAAVVLSGAAEDHLPG